MENETQEIVKEALSQAPADIQSLIFSDNLTEASKKLAVTHSLSSKNADILKEEIVFVLLGLTEEGELAQNVQVRLGVSPLRAHEIVSDIKIEIFAPVQKSLDELNRQQTTNNKQQIPQSESEASNGARPDTGYQTREPELFFEGTVRLTTDNLQPTTENKQQTTNNRQPTTNNKQPTTDNRQSIQNTPIPEQSSVRGAAKYKVQNTNVLPDDVQKAVASVEVTKQIQTIGQKHQLHVDTVGALLDETQRIMKGETHPKDYIRNLTKRLSVQDTKAKEIAVDINEQIFRPVRESLKKIHKIGEETSAEPTTNNLQSTTNNLQQVTYNKQPIRDAKHQIPDTKYQIPDTSIVPSREEALRELEYPPMVGEKPKIDATTHNLQPATFLGGEPQQPSELLEKKMEGPFALPQTKSISEKPADERRGEIKKRENYEMDPYREPVE